MALWGKTDALVSAPKWVARKATFDSASTSVVDATANTINLIPSNTGFSTGDQVYYNIGSGTVIGGLTNNTSYFVRVVAAGLIELYDTYANATASSGTTGRVDITGVGVGSHTLQRTGAANPVGDHNFNGQVLLFIDREEAQQDSNRAKGLKSPGWWLYRTYTDTNSVVRHKSSCLVAIDVLASVANDGLNDAADAVVADAIVVGTVDNQSVVAPNTATFSVTASASPSVTLAYQWQRAQSTAPDTWVDVGTNSSSFTTGATAVAAGAGDTNGDLYRVIVSATGRDSVTSNTATLTVTAA